MFDRWPGYDPTAGKGSAYSIAQARIKTAEIADEIVEAGYENVIFVGKRVAEAFGYPTDRILEWKWDVDRGFQWAILPHPSGVNRWWNASTHAREAERFLQGAIA